MVDESDAPDLPSPAAAGSWTGPLRREILLRLQLTDLLVEPGHKGVSGLLPFVLVPTEDADRSFQQDFSHDWNWPGCT